MANKINFTKQSIENLPIPSKDKRQAVYYDTNQKGLCVIITYGGTKTYYLYRKFKGRPLKIKLGNAEELTVATARKNANDAITELNSGENPNDKLRKERKEYTLGKLFEEYMTRYSKVHKKSWKYDEREIPKFLGHWFNRKLSEITHQEIRKLHEMTFSDSGKYQANRILERIKAMYNKAIEWGYATQNPANGIKKYKENKRDRFLQPNEIKAFFESLEQEPNKVARDYFKILLFTGARKSNVLAMRWNEINFELRIWRIPETKNGEPLEVPLIPYAIDVLKSIERTSEWVFPSETSENGHFADPKRPWKRILERANIKDLRIHDIRRTLASYQAITGTSLSIIGKTLGHKSVDATQIYARLNNDPVRSSMELAVDAILEHKEK